MSLAIAQAMGGGASVPPAHSHKQAYALAQQQAISRAIAQAGGGVFAGYGAGTGYGDGRSAGTGSAPAAAAAMAATPAAPESAHPHGSVQGFVQSSSSGSSAAPPPAATAAPPQMNPDGFYSNAHGHGGGLGYYGEGIGFQQDGGAAAGEAGTAAGDSGDAGGRGNPEAEVVGGWDGESVTHGNAAIPPPSSALDAMHAKAAEVAARLSATDANAAAAARAAGAPPPLPRDLPPPFVLVAHFRDATVSRIERKRIIAAGERNVAFVRRREEERNRPPDPNRPLHAGHSAGADYGGRNVGSGGGGRGGGGYAYGGGGRGGRGRDARAGIGAPGSHMPNTAVYVSGLPPGTTTEKLEVLFSGHGAIKRTKIYRHEDGRLKGDALITYQRPGSVEGACKRLNGVCFGGATLRVSPADFERQQEAADAQHAATPASPRAADAADAGSAAGVGRAEPAGAPADAPPLPAECEAAAQPVVLLRHVYLPEEAESSPNFLDELEVSKEGTRALWQARRRRMRREWWQRCQRTAGEWRDLGGRGWRESRYESSGRDRRIRLGYRWR
ncbi:unnamed protein product [Phaeothamnion confervicola]